MVELLKQSEISRKLESLPGWKIEAKYLTKRFEFADFIASVQFVNRIVESCEALNHHPDLEINYNRVTFKVNTHDKGGLTELDFQLAKKINELS